MTCCKSDVSTHYLKIYLIERERVLGIEKVNVAFIYLTQDIAE